MKTVVSLLFGMLAGVMLTVMIGWAYAPELMLIEHESPYSVEKTVEMIRGNAINEDWVVPGVSPIHKSIKKHGGGELPPVMLINICQPDYAYDILKEDDNKIVSVFMPCTISVYEKSDGKAYIGIMNAALLGRMFGGTVADIMGEKVAADQRKFIALN
ncbi:MAG: DUF302 domain-containing protein [Gammaproteobacteria bacterium]|nr:DUF302 domain-containing protein [Gammaproteobacteria bacterium]